MKSSTVVLGLMSFGLTKIAVKGGTWKGRAFELRAGFAKFRRTLLKLNSSEPYSNSE